ncbi:hypothetical protein ACFSDD_21225 [Salipiger marinus]|uniref:hypothetical protein n=1 Tax=Salipiger marinus TaxID=555512 RepID=UPI002C8DB72D|nr:hypothetical protein [Salipiger manganoxidans]MEB3417585.1 hypothetical protein [Salipiger manganoxidans]
MTSPVRTFAKFRAHAQVISILTKALAETREQQDELDHDPTILNAVIEELESLVVHTAELLTIRLGDLDDLGIMDALSKATEAMPRVEITHADR